MALFPLADLCHHFDVLVTHLPSTGAMSADVAANYQRFVRPPSLSCSSFLSHGYTSHGYTSHGYTSRGYTSHDHASPRPGCTWRHTMDADPSELGGNGTFGGTIIEKPSFLAARR